jgi:hypothetical protein
MRELRTRSTIVKKTGRGRLDHLPLEIRQLIYKHLFAGSRVEIASRNLAGCTAKPIRVNQAFKTAISLFRTSAIIYQEARPCLAAHLTLRILYTDLNRIRRTVKDFYMPLLRTIEFGSLWNHVLDISIFPSLEKLILVPRVPIKDADGTLCYFNDFVAHKHIHYTASIDKKSLEQIVDGGVDEKIKQAFVESLSGSWMGPLLSDQDRRYRIFVKLNLLPCYTHERDGLSVPTWCLKFALDDSMETIKRVLYYKENGLRFCKVWKSGRYELWLHRPRFRPWSRLLNEKWNVKEYQDQNRPTGLPRLVVKGKFKKDALVGFDFSEDQIITEVSVGET